MKRIVAMLLALLLALGMLGAEAEGLIEGEGMEPEIAEVGGPLAVAEAAEPETEAVANAAKTVAINASNFPDAAFRGYVKENFDDNGDGKLSAAEIKGATFIGFGSGDPDNVKPLACKNMKGVQYLTNLIAVYIVGAPLKTVDFSKNTKLDNIVIVDTNITSLNLSKNTKLIEVNIARNKLSKLTLGKLTKLKTLVCDNNKLKALDVSKCTALTYLDATANSLTSLKATGCKKLQHLYCSSNALTGLDVSKNTALKMLNCEYNKLTKLNVTKNTKLELLWCYGNALKALDLSKNTKLVDLHCGNNQLKALDVSKCKKLETMYCEGNAIAEIDIAKLPVYLRDLARNSEFEIGDGLMYIIPEDGKGLCLDASVKVIDGGKVVHQPA